MKGRKIVSTLLALLLLASLPVSALAEEYDLANGSIEVTASDSGQYVSQENGVQNEKQTTPTVITQTNSDTTPTENTLTINAEKDQTASVTLSGASIDVSGKGKAAVSTNGEGNVSIELNGDNKLKSGEGHAGLEKKNGGSLTIADKDENGKLTAEGGKYGAGIGGGNKGNGDNIAISGGDVKATGGTWGAGIGGGKNGAGSGITISGGEVEATGGSAGAGIGGGYEGDGSNITITDSKVTATGGYGGAGIGGGHQGAGSYITISGGEVKATGGKYGAGVGGGFKGNGNNIAITGGEVKATGGLNGAGIGGGLRGKGKDITVSGDAKLKVQGGGEDDYDGAGAGIGDGGSRDELAIPTPGAEVVPDTSGLTTNGSIEYYAPGADMEKDKPEKTTVGTLPPQEKPVEPIEPAEPEQPEAERGAAAPLYRVTDRDGRDIACTAERKDGVLTVTVDADFAVLTGSLSGMTALRAQGVEKIVFVTNGAKTAVKLSAIISKLTASGVFRLTHDGKAVTFTIG